MKKLIFSILFLLFFNVFGSDNTFFSVFGPEGKPEWGKMSDNMTFFIKIPKDIKNTIYVRILDADCGGIKDEMHGVWDTKTVFKLFTGKDAVLKYKNRGNSGRLTGKITLGNSILHENKWQTIFSINPAEIFMDNNDRWIKLYVQSINGNDGNLFSFFISSSKYENLPIGSKSFIYEPMIRVFPKTGLASYLPFKIPKGISEFEVIGFDNDNDIVKLISPWRSDIKIKSSGSGEFSSSLINVNKDEYSDKWGIVVGFISKPLNAQGFKIKSKEGKPIPFLLPFFQSIEHKRPRANFKYFPISAKNTIFFDASKSIMASNLKREYLWDFGDGTSGKGMQVTHQYKKTGKYRIKLRVSDMSKFADYQDRLSKDIFVNRSPEVVLSNPKTVTLNKEIIFNAKKSIDPDGEIIKYIWEIAGKIFNSTDPLFKYTFSTPGQYTLKLTVFDNSGVPNGKAGKEIKITANSSPIAQFISPKKGAINEGLFFNGLPSNDSDGEIITYKWDMGDGTKKEGAQIKHKYNKSGNYSIKLNVIDNSGVENNSHFKLKIIFINEPPKPNAGRNRYVAVGDLLSFSGIDSIDTDGDIIGYEWDFGDGSVKTGGNVTYKYRKPGYYKVVLKVTDNSGTISNQRADQKYVKVNSPPTPIIEGSSFITINPVKFSAALSSDKDGKIIAYNWDFGDGTSDSGKFTTHVFEKPGKYTVTLKATDDSKTNSKMSSITHKITVNSIPIANAGENIIAAPGEDILLNGDKSYDKDGNIQNWEWYLNDKIISDSKKFRYKFDKPGIYSVRLKVSDNSKDSDAVDFDTVKVHINSPPVVQFTIPGRLSPDKIYSFSANDCYDPDGDKLSYYWEIEDKQFNKKEIEYKFKKGGTSPIKLIINDNRGLKNSISQLEKTLWINNKPQSIIGDNIFTNRLTVELNGEKSHDPDSDELVYKWDLGDGSILYGEKIIYTYKKAGNYPVKLTISDGTGSTNHQDSEMIKISINEPPIADAGENVLTCAGQLILFNGSGSYDKENDLLKYEWDFGDGGKSKEMNPVHRYTSDGIYNVLLKVTDNSGMGENHSSDKILIQVSDSPVAKFSSNKKETCVGQTVHFDASDSTDIDGVVNSYYWDFGDAKIASGKKVDHTYENPGKYLVKLKVEGEKQSICKNFDITEMEINVIEGPFADFKFISHVCEGKNITFNASPSKSPSLPIKQFNWDFGDGESGKGELINHVYKKSGIFPVKLTIIADLTKSCGKATIVKSITVNDMPTVEIESPDFASSMEFVRISASKPQDKLNGINSYIWDFGDEKKKQGPFVFHKYSAPGDYKIRLTVNDGTKLSCSQNTVEKNIHINYLPNPVINKLKKYYLVNKPIVLDASLSKDKDGKIIEYKWIFSNGKTKGGEKIEFIPDQTGEYQVTLRLKDNSGLKNNFSQITHKIRVVKHPDIRVAVKNIGCPIGSFDLSVSCPDEDNLVHIWKFEDGSTKTGRKIKHQMADGNRKEIVKLESKNNYNLKTVKSIELVKNQLPVPNFKVSGDLFSDSLNDFVVFDASSSTDPEGNSLIYKWDFGDGTTKEGMISKHHFKKPGKYTVTLTIADSPLRCRKIKKEKIIAIEKR